MAKFEGELAWPERFPRSMDRKFEAELGPIAYAGQYQQSPTPRKGNIFRREYWQDYAVPTEGSRKGKFPEMDLVVVSVDSAFTEREENDPTGCTTWGIFTDQDDGYPKVMLLAGWRAHLPLHGEIQPPQARDEPEEEYLRRCFPHWGIVERVAWSCSRFGGADVLIIEAKASGLDVINEIRRLYDRKKWGVVQVNPKTDKVARAISVQPTFAQHLVYAPNRDWAEMVKDEMARFPKHKFKDLTDSATQALRWMRQQGLIHRQDEMVAALEEAKDHGLIRRNRAVPLYRA
jgi:phage terminase large subunit-like protein